jgi:hypothetical protein
MQQQFLAASGSFDLALEVGADWCWPFTKPNQWQWQEVYPAIISIRNPPRVIFVDMLT